MKAIYQNLFLTSLLILTLVVSVAAADGDLDMTFGNGGKATVDFDGNPTAGASDQDSGLDVAIQPDGKIIIVGETSIGGGDSVMSATRLNSDGTIDTSFGTNGKFMYNAAPGIGERAYGVAIQPDGKILIAGRTNSPRQRVVIRLNADGSFDNLFAAGGVFRTPIGSPTFDEPEIAVQPNGKIIVIGATRNGGLTTDAFSVMRLDAEGKLDDSFDSDGEAVTVFALNDRAYAVKLLSDGKILVSGGANNSNGFALARYNTDGSLDTTFDTDGKVTTTFPSANSLAYNMAIQSDGKIVAAGYARGQDSNGALIRYNTDGSLDTTFGTAGKKTWGTSSNEIFWDVHLKGGKIVATGNRALEDPSGEDDFMVTRFDGNGALDTNFGTNGVIYTGFGVNRDICLTSAFQPDGKLILAGYTTGATTFNPDFAAARYNFTTTPTDAPLDFNGDGKTDFAIMRPADSGLGAQYTWWINYNGTEDYIAQPLGLRGFDVFVPEDYDGDGKDDIAVFRQMNSIGNQDAGNWYIMESSTNTIRIERFGLVADNPTIVDDYDGDGKADLAVWRTPTAMEGPGQAYVFYRGSFNNPTGNITYIPWGMRYGTQQDQVDDIYTGDFDGDGKTDIAIQRRADTSVTTLSTPAVFWIRTATGNVSYQYFGWAGDRIVPGDYDGDGKTDLCTARGFNIAPGTTTWNIRYSSGKPDESIHWGAGAYDQFAQGDYDGDGMTDLAVYRRAGEFNFYVRSSSNGSMIVKQWGMEGDIATAIYNNR